MNRQDLKEYKFLKIRIDEKLDKYERDFARATKMTQTLDGMPKAPYSISDSVFNSVIQLQENKELNKSINEYKIVAKAIQLVNEDSEIIFNELYRKGKSKWYIIDEVLKTSEETYKRRKRELIYAVDKEIKKLT